MFEHLLMFEHLFASFPMDRPVGETERWEPAGVQIAGFGELMGRAAGCRFDRGVYRLHTAESAAHADSLVAGAYPEIAAQAKCFGYDWYGCQYALDFSRQQGDEPLVTILEPGTGEVLDIPETFLSFHEGIDGYRDLPGQARGHSLVTGHLRPPTRLGRRGAGSDTTVCRQSSGKCRL